MSEKIQTTSYFLRVNIRLFITVLSHIDIIMFFIIFVDCMSWLNFYFLIKADFKSFLSIFPAADLGMDSTN